MARVRLKGVNKVTTRLADGSLVTYWYAWKGGPRLAGHPGSPEFVQSYEGAHRQTRKADPKTFHAIISGYKQSRDFTDLTDKTRKDYLKCIARVDTAFADLPLGALNDPPITSDFIAWRDQLPGDRQRDYAWSVLMRLISWGRDRGLTTYRPPSRMKRTYKSDRADKIWLLEHISAFRAAASEQLWWALVLALETGQRQGDLIRLPWKSYDGTWLQLKQQKTGRRVAIPVSKDLKGTIEAIPQLSPIILTATHGRPWTSDGFRTSWAKAATKAKITGLTFHDLRGTAVTRLAECGCTEAEIASITGHSLGSVSTILDRYLARTKGLALAAISKLDQHKK
jgi:integrase